MARHITERQEQIYRMRHHDFSGMSTKQVAAMLGLTAACVTYHMQQMRKIAPQLFPILTKKQADVYSLYVCARILTCDVAKILDISVFTVKNRIYEMRRKGMFIPNFQRGIRNCMYETWMDSKITHKF